MPTDPSGLDLEPFDDGFIPSTCAGKPTRLLRQPAFPLARLPPGLTVLPEAVSDAAARAVYEFTAARSEPWGTYLRLAADGGAAEDGGGALRLEAKGAEPEVEALARAILQDLWAGAAGALMRPDLRHVHGFSVWAVCGGEGLQTDYHMDYAEVFRRRTNIVAPAIHAATLQVSPVAADGGDVEGGTFGAHAGGLAHYQAHGYKTRTRPAPDGKPTQDWGDDGGWSYAPYAAPRDSGRAILAAQFGRAIKSRKNLLTRRHASLSLARRYAFRQATLCDGTLPHAASRVERWPAGMRRVVVGINSMGFVEGPMELEVPQHSAAFRKMVKTEMLLQKLGPEQLLKKLHAIRRRKAAAAAAAAASGAPAAEEPAKAAGASVEAEAPQI